MANQRRDFYKSYTDACYDLYMTFRDSGFDRDQAFDLTKEVVLSNGIQNREYQEYKTEESMKKLRKHFESHRERRNQDVQKKEETDGNS